MIGFISSTEVINIIKAHMVLRRYPFRHKGSVIVMYNVATNQQQGLGTSLLDSGCLSSTSLTSKPKHTGSMKQLGQMKRQKSKPKTGGKLETPTSASAKLG